MVSVITILQFTSAMSAVCSIYAAVLGFSVKDETIQSPRQQSKAGCILTYRGVSYTRFPEEKIELVRQSQKQN
ncbi:hypothetical protein [[Limnothrix rosea] IAM M-220]|uniref:hypothetical protein n=1 Tax=[Limnothrix rosea] IAM M-220 TaxID=454133 RepID=UPI000960A2BD|nr:hypothetical protein [[Limnothrix rosea] IAM M-220]OKH17586.1 hypothetical protein NIES208_08735 [[Limnothrix rosea] IAM M-220]